MLITGSYAKISIDDILMLMSIVCPTILASNSEEYKKQIEKVQGFAKRIQIDLKDNIFAMGESMPLKDIWWPENIVADIHIMYKSPQNHLKTVINLNPSMAIVHAESDCDIPKFASDLRDNNIKTGLALLQPTSVQEVAYILPHVQHLLIFSGDLGHFGGTADLGLTDKISSAKEINPYLEFGWDGGVNDINAIKLAKAGVNVLNVGGFIQNSDNPENAYAKIKDSLVVN
jgi:ribulose-phosphate 3-epimerase